MNSVNLKPVIGLYVQRLTQQSFQKPLQIPALSTFLNTLDSDILVLRESFQC